jgi:AcrR family transcriptional regulator
MVSTTNPRSKTPGRRQPLTRERILDAAMHIVESEGLDALSMRRLGRELHVKDMALYHHFENKDEILSGLVNRMFDAFADISWDGKTAWDEFIGEVMRGFRAVGIRYPQTFLLYARKPFRSAHRDAGEFPCLLAAGFDRAHAEYVIRNLAEYVTGFVLRNDIRHRFSTDAGAGEEEQEHYDADAAFEFGLGAMINGCEQWLQTQTRGRD